jgi:uncharacterized OB-fold protein
VHLQVREADIQDATTIMAREFRKSTALADHDLSHLQAAFDPRATKTVCPACGAQVAPTTTTCPDCGLCIG